MKTYPSAVEVEAKHSTEDSPRTVSNKFVPFPDVRTDWHGPMRASGFMVFSFEHAWQDQMDAALKIIDSGIRKQPVANYPEAA